MIVKEENVLLKQINIITFIYYEKPSLTKDPTESGINARFGDQEGWMLHSNPQPTCNFFFYYFRVYLQGL